MARHGEFGSLPVLAPFYGRWEVYQGFNGPHTHQPPWQHALDFYIVEEGKSYRTDGVALNDYYCFGLPLLSPVAGFVVRTLDSLPDNPPGQVDMENNWGNHLLIRMDNGLYALLAHLKQGSIGVKVGAYLQAGQQVAECGSSGRSPQPHLHLHIQWGETLGSATHPFHLTTVLHQSEAGSQAHFKLYARPAEGERIMVPKTDSVLNESLQLGVGREFCYQVRFNHDGNEKTEKRKLHVALNLTGELRLVSDSGASAAFTSQDNLLAFYDRMGPADLFLDAWVLALGLTPLSEGELAWRDHPSMHLLPLSWQQFLLSRMFLPMGGGIDSHYLRQWDGKNWQQTGRHSLKLPFSQAIEATTAVSIEPHLGCRIITVESDSGMLEARLLEVGQKADAGIPAWRIKTDIEQENMNHE